MRPFCTVYILADSGRHRSDKSRWWNAVDFFPFFSPPLNRMNDDKTARAQWSTHSNWLLWCGCLFSLSLLLFLFFCSLYFFDDLWDGGRTGFPIQKLQSRVLHLHVFDYDRFSRDDSIGEVFVPLCQVCCRKTLAKIKATLFSSSLSLSLSFGFSILIWCVCRTAQVDFSEKPVFWKALKPPLKDKCGELLVSLCYHPTNSTLTLIALKARNLKAKDINGKSGSVYDFFIPFWMMDRIHQTNPLLFHHCFIIYVAQILMSKYGSISATNEWRSAKRPSTNVRWSRCLTKRSPSTCRGRRYANAPSTSALWISTTSVATSWSAASLWRVSRSLTTKWLWFFYTLLKKEYIHIFSHPGC